MKKTSDKNISRAIASNQTGIHERLEITVRKHCASPFQKPCAVHNIDAFQRANDWLQQQQRPLILDSFCGVGESTWQLAGKYPDSAVVGIDKSAARLAKHHAHSPERRLNYLLVQADVDDFWRLALAAGWAPQQHFLLYPNPWPKSSQLKLRVHGSPLFPTLLQLGGTLELRSNWQLYVEEFSAALNLAGTPSTAEPFITDSPLTPFERKYLAAGQVLWRCRAALQVPAVKEIGATAPPPAQ